MDADLEVRSSPHLGRPLYADMRARAGALRPATGAAAAAVTPRLNNAPTFEVFVGQVIDVVTTQGSASPSSVGDGAAIGAWSRTRLFYRHLWKYILL